MTEQNEGYSAITLEALWQQINTLAQRVEQLAQNAHGEAPEVVWGSFVDPQSGAEVRITRRTGSTDEEFNRLTNGVMDRLRESVEAGFIPVASRDGVAAIDRYRRTQRKNGKPPTEEPPSSVQPEKPSTLPSVPAPPPGPRAASVPTPASKGTPTQPDGTVVIDVVGLEKGTTRAGDELIRVKGGAWKPYGVAAYVEVYPSLDQWTDVEAMVMGQNYPATQLGLQAVVEVKDGKAKRVLSFHKK